MSERTPEETPGQVAGYVFDLLTDYARTTEISDEDLRERVQGLLERLFELGYPDVVAELWRRAGHTEVQIYELVMDAADRLDRDPDLVGDLVYGDWG